ncbi:hypothetical protein KI387_019157 [Taxus chinensis]|uniref:Protein kinase domain-containing protein n=1 Tax=Taxus chinensis TaxID=29808 RepID=A0AA38LA00_TAXCH|nr:hypothetical protein KI387_019157 [Taxus chinensis]
MAAKDMNLMSSYGLILALYLISTCSIDSEATANLTSSDFSYPTFEFPKGIETLGNASFENNVLQLTVGGLPHSVGRAVRSEALKIWDRSTGLVLSFTTTFTFSVQLLDPNKYGDGLAFGFFPDKIIPNNSGGGILGLYDSDSAAKNNVVAVEFDLFKNLFDPDSNHVGLDLNNVSSVTTSELTNYGVRLKAGNLINVKIDYDGSGGRLNVYAINASLGSPGFKNLVLSSNMDISRYIQNEEVFVGFSAATGDSVEYHTIHSWTFKTWSGGSSKRLYSILGASLGALAFVFSAAIIIAALLHKKRRSKPKLRRFLPISLDQRSNPTSDLSKEILKVCDWDVCPRKFSYEELTRATKDFDPSGLLGEGGFGDVYKGTIPCGNFERSIAVKRFSQSSNQSDREYLSEVAVIGRLRHRNLVQLQGWCHEGGELLLVYDYMPNGSVDQLLYDSKSGADLDWSKRLKICRGLASALLYLHEECQQRVVHRDVKTSNVMVDSRYEARLGDFGLARFVENHNCAASLTTSVGGGTLGYIAPERSMTGKATLESDVYSYGAVLLEIATGRRPIDVNTVDPVESVLVDWVWKLVKEDRVVDAADPSLGGQYDVEEMTRVLTVGLMAFQPDPSQAHD